MTTNATAQLATLFENFEYLTVLAREWKARHPSRYPKDFARLSPENLYQPEVDDGAVVRLPSAG